MATTDEMREKLIKENEEIKAKIKEIEGTSKPLRQQLEMNMKVLGIIYKRNTTDNPRRKYTKKKKEYIDES